MQRVYHATRKRPGHVSLLVLTCALAGCRPEATPAPAAISFDPSAFSGERALEEVRNFVELGPRDSGTAGAHNAARYLRARLSALGLEARLDAFEDTTPKGRTIFRNVIATLPGQRKERILLGSHYDSKSSIGNGFQGANDSGSSTGILLEMARIFAAQADAPRPGPGIEWVFFDGEEAMEYYGPHDGFHGSRHHARLLEEQGFSDEVLGVIVLDMVGDKDLTITLPRNSSPELLSAVFRAAHAENIRDRFSLSARSIGDDHVAFLERGMPAVDIIDFEYGSRPGRNDYWHTPEDRMDKISAESLAMVGKVTIRVVNELLQRTSDD